MRTAAPHWMSSSALCCAAPWAPQPHHKSEYLVYISSGQMSLELISLVPVTLLWVSNVHLDYWHWWGCESGQLRKRWNEEDEEMGQFIWVYLFPSLIVSDMPLIHNVHERKHPGQERGEGSAVVQCCRGTLLMTSRIQLQHDANHLTGKLTQLQAQSPLSKQ